MAAIALIIGGSRDVWADLERALALTDGLDRLIVATNYAGKVCKLDLDAWATLHPESFAGWREERAGRGLNTDYRAVAHRRRGDVEVVPLAWSGSSGLYGAQVAVQALGAAGAILCGAPLDAEAGHFSEPGAWGPVEKYRNAVLAAKEAGLPVRSMSGWTAEALGEPDAAWLQSLNIGPARKRRRKAPEATMRIKMRKTKNFIVPEDRRLTVKYLDGQEYTVKRAWGRAMVRAGEAREVKAPARPASD